MLAPALHEIQATLIDLDRQMKGSDTHGMIASMERLDALAAGAGDTLDPRLRHFLERRSYAKALAWISGDTPAAPSGPCSSQRG